MEKLYTVQEVAEILKITEGTLRNYLSAGKVNFIKVLGNTRIKESELKRLISPEGDKDEQ
jgi:excisionase family DNA binding protein